MLTKLRTNPGAYDVVLVNSARSQQAAADGLLDTDRLLENPERIRAVSGIEEPCQSPARWQDQRCRMGLGHQPRLRLQKVQPSRIVMPPSAHPSIKAKSPCSTTPSRRSPSVLFLRPGHQQPGGSQGCRRKAQGLQGERQAPLVEGEDQWNKSFAAKEFDLRSTGRVRRFARSATATCPSNSPWFSKEGGIGWLDSLSIPASAPDPEAAATFITLHDRSDLSMWNGRPRSVLRRRPMRPPWRNCLQTI